MKKIKVSKTDEVLVYKSVLLQGKGVIILLSKASLTYSILTIRTGSLL